MRLEDEPSRSESIQKGTAEEQRPSMSSNDNYVIAGAMLKRHLSANVVIAKGKVDAVKGLMSPDVRDFTLIFWESAN